MSTDRPRGRAHVDHESLQRLSDADVLDLVRSGSLDAAEELFIRHHHFAVACARQHERDQHRAEDLAAEALSRTVLAVQGGLTAYSFRGYVAVAIRNRWIDLLRRDRRVVLVGSLEDLSRLEVVARHQVALDLADSVVSREIMRSALATLPPRQQVVLLRTAVEGYTPSQVADEFGITANAVSALAFRARAALREAYLARTR